MAAATSDALPPLSAGPAIDGTPTTVHLIEAAALPAHPLRPALRDLINRAFSHAHPPWLPASLQHVEQPEGVEQELGPTAFTLAITVPPSFSMPPSDSAFAAPPGTRPESSEPAIDAPERLVASVSARVFAFMDPATVSPVLRRFLPPTDPRRRRADGAGWEPIWEPKLMATEPALVGRGLGSMLLGLLEREMCRRWAGAEAAEGRELRGRRLLVYVQTLKELNEQWYAKRGFEVMHETAIEKGFMGSENGCTLIGLTKEI